MDRRIVHPYYEGAISFQASILKDAGLASILGFVADGQLHFGNLIWIFSTNLLQLVGATGGVMVYQTDLLRPKFGWRTVVANLISLMGYWLLLDVVDR